MLEWNQNPVPINRKRNAFSQFCFRLSRKWNGLLKCQLRLIQTRFYTSNSVSKRIYIITIIWSLVCTNHCIFPNNLLKEHLFLKKFGTIFSFDPGLIGSINLNALWRSHLTSVRVQFYSKFVSWHIDQAFKIELEIMKIHGHSSTHMP